MSRKGSVLDREKVNFMLSKSVLMDLRELIAAGERSDFVDGAVATAMAKMRAQKFSEGLDALRMSDKKTFTNKEILKSIHEGRK